MTPDLVRPLHLEWVRQNHRRLVSDPSSLLEQKWKIDLLQEFHFSQREGEWIENQRSKISDWARLVPRDANAFIRWFEDLKQSGPGQNDALFPWLAEQSNYEQMRWFIKQEVAGEAGFDDLVALTQLKLPVQAKLELARNYWDEMGRGTERGMHGPMLGHLAEELGLNPISETEVVTEALALANLMVGMAFHRRYTYHSIGALGVIELTAPQRASCVYQGMKRLNISSVGRQYYLLHSTLDVKHSEAWNREVLYPLISHSPETAPLIAEGAFLRLNAGKLCYQRYREEFQKIH